MKYPILNPKFAVGDNVLTAALPALAYGLILGLFVGLEDGAEDLFTPAGLVVLFLVVPFLLTQLPLRFRFVRQKRLGASFLQGFLGAMAYCSALCLGSAIRWEFGNDSEWLPLFVVIMVFPAAMAGLLSLTIALLRALWGSRTGVRIRT